MDEFMKNLTSKAPIKPSEIPRLPSTSDLKQRIKEINENDQDLHHHHQMGSKLQNSKKASMAKNFMSPTVSASSKATTPRKKILVERNEASSGMIFSDTHLHKRSTHASADLLSSPITKLPPKVSEMEDTGIDSVSQPYDPLTNFLSPRPKFLRYNPNRRLEILLRREGEMKEGQENELTDTSSESEKMVEDEVPSDADADADGDGDASSSSSEEGSKKPEEEEETHEPKKPEDESSGLKELGLNPPPSKEEETHENGDEEEDEEIEEVEEEEKGKHGYLNQAMKFLLLLVVLTLSTLYVSSMNSPTPPPTLQALRDYKVEYLKIPESFVVWGTTFLDQMEEYNQNLLMEAIERKNEEGVTKEEIVEEEEWEEEEVEEVSDQVDEEMLEVGEGEKEEDFFEEIQCVKEEVGIQKEEMIVEEMEGKSVELSDLMEVILDEDVLEAESTSLNEVMVAAELEKTGDVTDESHDSMVEDELVKTGDELVKTGDATNESHDTMVEDELEKTGDATDENHNSMVADELAKTGDATDESHDFMEKTSVISQTLEDLPQTQNSVGADTPSISEPEVTSSQKEVEDTEPMEIELTEKRAIGITVISVILAYIILNFLRIIRRRKPSAKDSSVTFKKPSFEYAAKEKNGGTTQMLLKKEGSSTPGLFKKEEINAERIVEKAAESYIKPCSSIFSGVQDFKEISRIQAPTVELLGEYVVEELNSSFKSCSLKPKKTVECEESIFSVSLDQKPRRMAFSSPVHQEHPSLSEFSAINSPSYGSFTPQEKSGRKKEARDGEEAFQMATTPLRRSSRLRSKSVTSP